MQAKKERTRNWGLSLHAYSTGLLHMCRHCIRNGYIASAGTSRYKAGHHGSEWWCRRNCHCSQCARASPQESVCSVGASSSPCTAREHTFDTNVASHALHMITPLTCHAFSLSTPEGCCIVMQHFAICAWHSCAAGSLLHSGRMVGQLLFAYIPCISWRAQVQHRGWAACLLICKYQTGLGLTTRQVAV